MGAWRSKACLGGVLAAVAFAASAAPSGAAELPTDAKCEFIANPGSSVVHAAVPRRLLHEGRPDEPDRPADQLPDEMMPTNVAGEPIEATPYNESDGFSPGSVIR